MPGEEHREWGSTASSYDNDCVVHVYLRLKSRSDLPRAFLRVVVQDRVSRGSRSSYPLRGDGDSDRLNRRASFSAMKILLSIDQVPLILKSVKKTVC